MKELIKNLKFAWGYTKDQKKYLVILLISNIFDIVLRIISPILSAKIIIELTSNDYTRIILVALALLVINLFLDLIHYISRRCSINIYRKTLSVIEVELSRNVLKIENKCLDAKGSGVFIERLTKDTSRMADVFNSLFDQVSNIIKHLGILAAVFIVNKVIFIYSVISISIIYLLERKRTNIRNNDDKEYRKSSEKVSGFIGELVRGSRDIKMLNSEDDFINNLSLKIDDANEKRLKMQRTSSNYKLGIWSITDVSFFILIILLVILMKNNAIIPATALILYNYVTDVSYFAYYVGDIFELVKDFNLSCNRVYDIFNSKEFEKETFGTMHLDKVNGDFEFKNVNFSYKRKRVLKDLSFKINANETVAFVGKSGAGKTTIFNLLCKMYKPSKGSITIDGIDINKLDKDSIRGNITIISQNPYIFNMSIKDNLKIVKSDLTKKEMEEACHLACLDDFIKTLPDGYDTVVGEGGVNLSGGQKQRLAIARALVQKTEIILFDEATSALDNETQEKIAKAIDNMKNEYTILIIAHRLSTIINSDRILYLDDGHILAEGSHSYLMKNCIKYKELYKGEINKD